MTDPAHLALMSALVNSAAPAARAWAKLATTLVAEDTLGLTLLAMTCNGDLIEPVVRAQGWDLRQPLDGLRRLASMHLELPEVERGIDRALEKGQVRVAGDLIRAFVPWTHESVERWLDQEHRRAIGALLLATVEPELIEQWCTSDRPNRSRDLIDPLRALALVESSDALTFLLEVRDELADDDDRDALKVRERVDGFIATSDPRRFARGVLMDELETAWLRRPEALADVLAIHGESSWLETLAYLEIAQTMTAFEFAALLGFVASTSAAMIEDEDAHERVISLIEGLRTSDPSWEGAALDLGLQIALGLGDEDMTPLLIEVALHERLLTSALPSPGIIGLPLSTNVPEGLSAQAALSLLEHADNEQDAIDDEEVVMVVHTLLDLARWHKREAALVAAITGDPVLDALADHANGAINLAARHVLALLGRRPNPTTLESPRDAMSCARPWLDAQAILSELTRGESVVSLWAISQVNELDWPQSLIDLGEVWLDCAPAFSSFVLDVARELVAVELADSAEE